MESNLVNYIQKLQNEMERLQQIIEPYRDIMPAVRDNVKNIEQIYIDKLAEMKPQIMVYGIYNAGKSSIINALVGEERAKVADIPTTDNIDFYEWNGYKIADTPGVGAPIEHQKVTEEHLKKADIVLFVMSTSGSHDKKENYTRMKDIAAAGKKIIIVLNDKQGDLGKNDINLSEIKGKVISNMQTIGISGVDEFCIVTVNALRAKNGRLKNNDKLVQMSNFEELEKIIKSELKNTNSFDIIKNAVYEIEKSLALIISELDENENQEEIKNLNEILNTLREQKINIRKEIKEYISRVTGRLGQRLPDIIWEHRQEPEVIDKSVQMEIQKTINLVQKEMEIKIMDMQSILATELEGFLAKIKNINVALDNDIKVGMPAVEEWNMPKEGVSWEERKVQIDKLAKATKEIYDIYKASKSAIDVSKLAISGSIVKTFAPDITGIIAKRLAVTSIGKILGGTAITGIGGSIAQVVIPYIGPILTIIAVVKSFFGDNGDMERAQAEAAARNEYEKKKAAAEIQARQELQQKCVYLCDDVADELSHAMNDVLNEIIGNMECNFIEQIEVNETKQSDRRKAVSELRKISDEYNSIRMEISMNN